MWIFINDAFLSIVADEGDKRRLLVRARKKGDIEAVFTVLRHRPEISHTPEHDYAYRAFIPKSIVARVVAKEVQSIDYTNFKNSVENEGRHNVYLQVWTAMKNWQASLTRR